MAEVAAALKAAGQPPLSASVPSGSSLHQLRSRGLQAKARLDERRRKNRDVVPTAAKRSTPSPAAPRTSGAARRLSTQDKLSGVGRLRARVVSIERQLRQAGSMRPHARAKLEEELGAARRLLARWEDTH